jgi:hypothetical protein
LVVAQQLFTTVKRENAIDQNWKTAHRITVSRFFVEEAPPWQPHPSPPQSGEGERKKKKKEIEIKNNI